MSTHPFSFQNLFLNIGSGLSQIFLSRELILLGSKLDSLNITDASNIIVSSFLSMCENKVGDMISVNLNMSNINFEPYNTILTKCPYLVDYVKNRCLSAEDKSKIDYSGIFDILLEKEVNPLMTFLTIIGSDQNLLEIFEPLITLSMASMSVQKIKTFDNLIMNAACPFIKFIINIYGRIFLNIKLDCDSISMKYVMDELLNMIKSINKTIDDYNK